MINLVLANITHRPMRTVVSILALAVGVLLIVFTVGLAHGMLHDRGKRDANINAEIMVRASDTRPTGNDRWVLPTTHAQDLAAIPASRGRSNRTGADKSDGLGSRFSTASV